MKNLMIYLWKAILGKQESSFIGDVLEASIYDVNISTNSDIPLYQKNAIEVTKQEIAETKNTFKELIEKLEQELTEKEDKIIELDNHMKLLIMAAGLYVTLKDDKGHYIWCDTNYCNDFLRIPVRCDLDIKGFTDKELIENYINCSGNHTYLELYGIGDNHCLTKHVRCRYYEIFCIDNQLIIYDVLRAPVYFNDKIYIVSFIFNRSGKDNVIFPYIDNCIKDGSIQVVYRSESSGLYYFKHENIDQTKCEFTGNLPGKYTKTENECLI